VSCSFSEHRKQVVTALALPLADPGFLSQEIGYPYRSSLWVFSVLPDKFRDISLNYTTTNSFYVLIFEYDATQYELHSLTLNKPETNSRKVGTHISGIDYYVIFMKNSPALFLKSVIVIGFPSCCNEKLYHCSIWNSPIRDTDQWRRRYNEELYQLHTEPEIVKWIRSARLRWAGHIVRKRESDPARKSNI
jgi:hypothetical protein